MQNQYRNQNRIFIGWLFYYFHTFEAL